MTNCNSCNVSGDRKYKKSQRGGAHTSLSPASLSSSDSIDRAGNSLANAAHKVYLEKNYEMAGGDTPLSPKSFLPWAYQVLGGRKRKYKTAKKYRSKSKSKKQRGGFDLEMNEPRYITANDGRGQQYEEAAKGGKRGGSDNEPGRLAGGRSRRQRGGILCGPFGNCTEAEGGRGRRQRGGILELGAFINEAAVPFGLLAAQQRYRRGTKGYKGRKSRKFRGSKRRR